MADLRVIWDRPVDGGFEDVTVEELRAMYAKACKEGTLPDCDECVLKKDAKTGLYYVEHSFCHCHDLLVDHLAAEELFAVRKEVDWLRVTDSYEPRAVFFIGELIRTPLSWMPVPEEISKHFVLEGRIAAESEPVDEEGFKYINNDRLDLGSTLYNDALCWFASALPKKGDVERTARYHDVPADMILWDRLLVGVYFEHGYAKFHPQASTLKGKIKDIYRKCGAAKAVEIVELLREDWEDIAAMELFGLTWIKDEEIENIRATLFEGMNRTLRIWKAECGKPTKQNPAPEPVHVVIDNVKDFVPDQEAFEQSVYPRKKDYAAVVEWLEKQKAKGTDFYVGAGYNRTEMCRTLTKIFGWDVSENSLRKAQNPPKK